MSLTALAWTVLASSLIVGSVIRPAWAVALYFLTFFAAPQLWWWGDELPDARYALIAGFVLLVSAALHDANRTIRGPSRVASYAAIAMIVNATFVHFFLASRPDITFDGYVELLGDDAEQHGINAGSIGIGQLGQVAHAHHHGNIRVSFTQTMITDDGVR